MSSNFRTCQMSIRLSLLIWLLEGINCKNSFDLVRNDCEKANVSESLILCLSARVSTGVISIHRKQNLDTKNTGVIARFSMLDDGNTRVTLVGAYTPEYEWISLAIVDVSLGSMGRGGPSLVCMHHGTDSMVRMYFLGTWGGALALTSFAQAVRSNQHTIGTKSVTDFFKNATVLEEVDGLSRFIVCNFTITTKMWKFDFTEMDLVKIPYNVALSQGRVIDRDHILGDPTSLEPSVHNSKSRFVSPSKYFLHRPAKDQTHISAYLGCGVTDYCIGAGFDECGRLGFDCKYFVKFMPKSSTSFSVILRGTTFHSFIGIGFSTTANILPQHRLVRWLGLKFIVVCEAGKNPTVVHVNCTQKTENDTQGCDKLPDISSDQLQVTSASVVTKFTMINSNDLEVDVISCEFDLNLNGNYLKMFKVKGTRLFLGGDDTGAEEWVKVLRLYPINDTSVFFITAENEALLNDKDSLPVKDVWELIKEDRFHFRDPAYLDPRVDTGSKSIPFYILTSSVIFILFNYF